MKARGKEIKFNSQICTSREQSERLLALGLKDMCWRTTTLNGEPITYPSQDVWLNGSIITNNHFPAWSLHRLIEMCPDYIQETYFGVSAMDVSYYFSLCEGSIGYKFVREGGNLYDNIIDCIEWLIKEEYFPKEYLV